jgi:hypothetical protein
MKEQDDFELDAHALAMISAYRQEEALPPAVEDRVWERVEAEVGVPATTGVGAAKWGVGLLAAAAAIAAVVIGAQVLTPSEASRAPQQAPYEHSGERDGGEVERPLHVERKAPREPIEAATPPVSPLAVPTHEAAPAIELPRDDERSSKPRARRALRDDAATPPSEVEAVPAPEPAKPIDTLAEETRVLGRARDALSASRPNDALAILDEYKRKFPSGRLAPERAALRVIALCDAGRSDEGSKAADAFLAAHSGHALASRVRRACNR